MYIFDDNFSVLIKKWPKFVDSWQGISIGSGNGLAARRWQAIAHQSKCSSRSIVSYCVNGLQWIGSSNYQSWCLQADCIWLLVLSIACMVRRWDPVMRGMSIGTLFIIIGSGNGCRLIQGKPIPKPVLTYCQLELRNTWRETQVNLIVREIHLQMSREMLGSSFRSLNFVQPSLYRSVHFISSGNVVFYVTFFVLKFHRQNITSWLSQPSPIYTGIWGTLCTQNQVLHSSYDWPCISFHPNMAE